MCRVCPPPHNIPVSAGVLCEINEDDCAPLPGTRAPKCLHNGTCLDRVGGYGCACPPGYTGARCEGDVNECHSQPCHPPGTLACVQGANTYRCLCQPGFTGGCCWGGGEWVLGVGGGARVSRAFGGGWVHPRCAQAGWQCHVPTLGGCVWGVSLSSPPLTPPPPKDTGARAW